MSNNEVIVNSIDLSPYTDNSLYNMLCSGIITSAEFVAEMKRRDALLASVGGGVAN